MRELSTIESREVAGAISTSDILNFFRNYGRTNDGTTGGKPPVNTLPGNGAGMGEIIGVAAIIAVVSVAAAIVGSFAPPASVGNR